MYRIALIDDHTLFRKSLISLLNEVNDVKVVYDTDDGELLLDFIKNQEVDLVLLDLQMPKMDGFTLSKQLREQYPKIKILAISQMMTEEVIYRLVKVGVNGYISKTSEPNQFETALKNVLLEGFYFDLPLAEIVRRFTFSDELQHTDFPRTTSELISPREREIILYTAKGWTSEIISKKLCISVRTVDSHKRTILEKTGCSNIIAVIVKCLNEYVISLDELK